MRAFALTLTETENLRRSGMMESKIATGMSLRKALYIAQQMDCRVNCRCGTGELIISHPEMGKRIRVNARRKDAPRSLTKFLMRVLAVIGGIGY